VTELLQLLPNVARAQTRAFSFENKLLRFLQLLRQARPRTHNKSVARPGRNNCNNCNNSPLFFYLLSPLGLTIRYFRGFCRLLLATGTVEGLRRRGFESPNT